MATKSQDRRKVRLSRALGVALTPKAAKYLEKRPYAPGEHGRTKRKQDSDYAVRLREKQRLREQYGIRDVGIYAVDSLRLDKCYRSWKQDLEIGFSPFDASLDRFVDMGKPDFVGKAALEAELAGGGPAYRFVPMVLDEPGTADAPFCATVLDADGEDIGIVTSGGWSFTLDCSIALGYVRPAFAEAGTKVGVKVYGQVVSATVQAEPIYDPTNARLRA